MKSQYIVISVIIILLLFNIISVVNFIYNRDRKENNLIFKNDLYTQEEEDKYIEKDEVIQEEVSVPIEETVVEEEVFDSKEHEYVVEEENSEFIESENNNEKCIEDVIETYKDQLEVETQKFLTDISNVQIIKNEQYKNVDTSYDYNVYSEESSSNEIYKIMLSWMQHRMIYIYEDYLQNNNECLVQHDITTISNAFHEYVRKKLLSVEKQFYINYSLKYDVPATEVGFNALLRNCNKDIKYDVHQDMYEFIESYLSSIPKCSELIKNGSGAKNIGCCPINDKCVNCSPVTSARRKCYCCLNTKTNKYNSYMVPCERINNQISKNLTKLMKNYGKSVCLNNSGCKVVGKTCICQKLIDSTSFVPCMKSNEYKTFKDGCQI